MPSYEYECPNKHRFTKFYRSFAQASVYEDHSPCDQCEALAERVPSVPLNAHLLGNPDGYHRPSPTKRFNTKTVSQLDGNKWSGG